MTRTRSARTRRRNPKTAADYQCTQTEHAGAAALIDACKLHPWGHLVVHVPNESSSPYLRTRGALEGVRKGYPDYLVDAARGGWFGCRFELKRPGEGPEPGQLWWLQELAVRGYLSWWSDDWERSYQWIVEYMSWEPTDKGTLLRRRLRAYV